jgi:U2 small nuclear ribonucleoprotein B''
MISRLDGTVKAPEANGSAAKPVEQIKSIFAAPPVSGGAPGTSAAPGTGLPAPPTLPPPTGSSEIAQGTKRPREEDEEEGGDAPMDEDEDEGGAMDMDESDED